VIAIDIGADVVELHRIGTDNIGPARVRIQIGWSSTGQPRLWV
jgi:hypothetical protein